jgi:hypothetical protein
LYVQKTSTHGPAARRGFDFAPFDFAPLSVEPWVTTSFLSFSVTAVTAPYAFAVDLTRVETYIQAQGDV